MRGVGPLKTHNDALIAFLMNSKNLTILFYALVIITFLAGCSINSSPTVSSVPEQPDLIVEGVSYDYASYYIRDSRLSALTRVLKIIIRNQGGPPVGDTQTTFWDGDPRQGGTLIGTARVPPIKGKYPLRDCCIPLGGIEEIEFFWNIRNKGGRQYICVEVDSNHDVNESDETNNITCENIDMPMVALIASPDARSYNPGDTVSINVEAINLLPSVSLSLTLETLIRYEGRRQDMSGYDTQTIQLPAGGQTLAKVLWSADLPPGGRYEATIHTIQPDGYNAWTLTSFRVNHSARFHSFSPLTGTAPLTITFYDYSTSENQIDGWQWDFGDGDISTETNPTHVYTKPGLYAVTLTTTVGLTHYTHTKSDYVNVLLKK